MVSFLLSLLYFPKILFNVKGESKQFVLAGRWNLHALITRSTLNSGWDSREGFVWAEAGIGKLTHFGWGFVPSCFLLGGWAGGSMNGVASLVMIWGRLNVQGQFLQPLYEDNVLNLEVSRLERNLCNCYYGTFLRERKIYFM